MTAFIPEDESLCKPLEVGVVGLIVGLSHISTHTEKLNSKFSEDAHIEMNEFLSITL